MGELANAKSTPDLDGVVILQGGHQELFLFYFQGLTNRVGRRIPKIRQKVGKKLATKLIDRGGPVR
jgi:hypothetical protein